MLGFEAVDGNRQDGLLFCPENTTSIIFDDDSANHSSPFHISISPFEISLSSEKSAMQLDGVNVRLPLCIVDP